VVTAFIIQVTDQPVFLRTKVDCQPTLAYACDMKPPGELGLKDFPTPHALTLPRLLLMTSWALFGALTWIAFQKPWGQVGYGIFNLLGIIVGFLITRITLPTWQVPHAGPGLCLETRHPFTPFLDTKRKATICTDARVEICTSAKERDSWSF